MEPPEIDARSMPSQRQTQRRRSSLHADDEEENALLDNGLARRPSTSSPRSLSNDIDVCNNAWRKLSCPTRSILSLIATVLLISSTYEFAVNEGVREQEAENQKEHNAVDYSIKSWEVFGGGGERSNNDINTNSVNDFDMNNEKSDQLHPVEQNEVLNERDEGKDFHQTLVDTRARAQELISTLNDYYGGEEKANVMLVNSWQARWMLDDEYSFIDGSDNDEGNRELRRLKRSKGKKLHPDDHDENGDDEEKEEQKKKEKRNKVKEQEKTAPDGNVQNDGNKAKEEQKKKKDKVKQGKVVENPEDMSPEELEQHHHYRRQRTTKLITTMARALLNPNQDTFLIGTIGSSVAAGHDNCAYDSYENQLQRTLTPLFAAANMQIIVQNAGEGGGCGDTHQNQVFCITHNVSPKVDIIHYSWTYFERETPEVQREQLIRWAQHMERRPMVHHLVARGKKNTCDGDVKANVDLDNTYAIFGYNAFCIQTGLYFGGHDYDAESEAGINRFGWQFHGDGYHNTTRYGEELPDGDPRRESLGTVYRNWHPGPLGFQVASDAFAYVYTMGLLKTLDIIEQDMNAGLNILDRWFDSNRRLELATGGATGLNSHRLRTGPDLPVQSSSQRHLIQLPPLGSMPEPLFCDPLYCSTPHPPSCLNYEKPTFGVPGITVQTQSTWEITHDDNKWNYMVGKVDTALIKNLNDPDWEKRCTHADACGGITAQDSTQGVLTYELPSSRMTAGLVFLCGCCGKKVGEDMFLNNQNVAFTLNGRVLDKTNMDVYPNPKCIRLLKFFGDGEYNKEDTMLLSIRLTDTDSNGTLPTVMISHIVAL